MDRLAIVVPCYNEEEMLPLTTKELTGVLSDLITKQKIAPDSYILYVDDGSKDSTWELIRKLLCGRIYAGGRVCYRIINRMCVLCTS